MDTVLQAASRMLKNQVFLVHVPANFIADVCSVFQGRPFLNIYMERGARLAPSLLSGAGGGVQLFKALVLVMNYFVISTVMRFIFNNRNNYFIKKRSHALGLSH